MYFYYFQCNSLSLTLWASFFMNVVVYIKKKKWNEQRLQPKSAVNELKMNHCCRYWLLSSCEILECSLHVFLVTLVDFYNFHFFRYFPLTFFYRIGKSLVWVLYSKWISSLLFEIRMNCFQLRSQSIM